MAIKMKLQALNWLVNRSKKLLFLSYKLFVSMNKETLVEITTNVLNAGYLDVEYLANKIEEYKLSVDEIVESVEQDF